MAPIYPGKRSVVFGQRKMLRSTGRCLYVDIQKLLNKPPTPLEFSRLSLCVPVYTEAVCTVEAVYAYTVYLDWRV